MKSNKDKVLELYFIQKLKQVEIAKQLNISNNAVSKILKKDIRFIEEKNCRKQLNKKKHNKEIQKRVSAKRQAKSSLDNYILKQMHKQASMELSEGRKNISNRAFRDWNPSVYEYNSKSRCYELKKGINTGVDVPRKINWNL